MDMDMDMDMDARHTHRCAIGFSYWIGRGSEEGCFSYHVMVCQILSLRPEG